MTLSKISKTEDDNFNLLKYLLNNKNKKYF